MPRAKASRDADVMDSHHAAAAAPRQRRHRPRRALRWLALVLALLVAAVAAGEISGWPFVRAPLQKALTRGVGSAVALEGDFRLRLFWHPGLRVGRLFIAAPAQLDLPAFVDAREVDLRWRWRDLWRWRQGGVLAVQSLQADVLRAWLVRDASGNASWPRSSTADEREAGAAPEWPRIGLLRVRDGRIEVDDAPLQTQLRVGLQGGEGSDATADGGADAQAKAGYRFTIEGRWRALDMKLTGSSGSALPLLRDATQDVAPDGTQDATQDGDAPLHIEGRVGAARLRFDGRAAALLGERRLQGALRLSGPSLAAVAAPLGVTLPTTPPFELRAQLAQAAGVWRLQAERAVIGSSRLDGDFRFDTRVSPPRLQGRLGGQRLALADLGPAVGQRDKAASKRTDGRVLPQHRFDVPSLRAMDADVDVAIDALDFGSKNIEPLLDLRTALQLQGGVLRLRELSAHAAGGRFQGATELDANAQPARWNVDLRFAKVDIARWLPGLRPSPDSVSAPAPAAQPAKRGARADAAAPADQGVRAYVTGRLSGALKATGRGESTADILGSLDGRAQLMLRDGTVSHLATEAIGLDVAQALGVALRGDKPLPLRCGWLDLAVKDGLVQVQQGVFDNEDTELRVEGQVSLRDEKLALRLAARPKDVSPFTLRSPVLVGGTLGDVDVRIEPTALAAKALGAVVLGAAINPLAAVLPFIDLGVGDENDACARKPSAPASVKPAAPK